MISENKEIRQLLETAENNIRQVKSILFSTDLSNRAEMLEHQKEDNVIEGIFDGEFMIGSDKKTYSVPANYASKSKLIPGDLLKLKIMSDGSFVFKQIGPVSRKKIVGELQEISKNKFVVLAEKKEYMILSASVTYFKAKNHDKVTIIIPQTGDSAWAAMENVI